jgi:hypothetical protein
MGLVKVVTHYTTIALPFASTSSDLQWRRKRMSVHRLSGRREAPQGANGHGNEVVTERQHLRAGVEYDTPHPSLAGVGGQRL